MESFFDTNSSVEEDENGVILLKDNDNNVNIMMPKDVYRGILEAEKENENI